MRQRAQRLLVAPVMQLVRVIAKHLSLSLEVIENTNLLSNELTNPNRTWLGFRSGAANIPEQPNGQQRIGRHLPDAALLARLGKQLGQGRTLQGVGAVGPLN